MRPAEAADLAVKAQPKSSDVPFFLLIDDRMTFAYMPDSTYAGYYSRNPNGTYDGTSVREVVALTHFDIWAYGTNFLNVQMTKSDHNTPAAPCTNAGSIFNGVSSTDSVCAGAATVYGQLRSTFGWNELFETKTFTMGPLHNISFEVGADLSADNTFNSANKRSFVAGLQFAFELPYKGYFNVAPLAYKEFNHSAFDQCGTPFAGNLSGVDCLPAGNTEYDTTWSLELNYYMDLGFLPETMRYWAVSGRATWVGTKGNQDSPLGAASGEANTAVSLDSEPIRFTFDAGKAIWGQSRSHFVDLWAAYRYAQNKAGYNHETSSLCVVKGVSNNSCTESTLYTGITVKF
jgi:hypothetical protein